MVLKLRFLISQIALVCLLLQGASPATAQTLDYFYDPTFAPPNVVGGTGGSANAILVHDDGRYMVGGGFQTIVPHQINKYVRFHNDGSIDESFSTLANPLAAGRMRFYQDAYLIHGTTGMSKMNMDGSLPGFPMSYLNHPYKPSFPPFPEYRTFAVTDGDMIVQAGRFYPDSNNLSERRFLVRVYPDGSPDHSFEPLQTDAPPDGRVSGLWETPDGKWMITGTFNHVEGFETPSIARLNHDFSVDTTFQSPFPDKSWSVRILRGDNPTKLSGTIDHLNRTYIRVIDPNLAFPGPIFGIKYYRLLPNGEIDTTFQAPELEDTRHTMSSPPEDVPGIIECISFELDGTLIVGGSFRKVNGHPRGNIAKLNENGSLIENAFHRQGADTALWLGGWFDNPVVFTYARLDDGRLMVGGLFSRYDGHDQWGVVRLLPSPVSVAKMETQQLHVYPNPAFDQLTVEIPAANQGKSGSILIYNAAGKLMNQTEEYLHNRMQISTSHLPNGMYFIHIRTGELNGITRFVKQ